MNEACALKQAVRGRLELHNQLVAEGYVHATCTWNANHALAA